MFAKTARVVVCVQFKLPVHYRLERVEVLRGIFGRVRDDGGEGQVVRRETREVLTEENRLIRS